MKYGNFIPDEYWKSLKIPVPIREYRFSPPRRYRLDYAWIGNKIAMEIEGGIFTKGRHTRGYGFLGDMEKYNLLAELGWRLFRYQPNRVDFDQVRRVVS